MANGCFSVPVPHNEPIFSYAPGTKERTLLEKEIQRQLALQVDIPLIIGGQEIRTGNTEQAVCPHDHQHVLGTYHQAGEKEIRMAVKAAMDAKKEWEALDWQERAAIFLKMAELITVKYRYILNAATMLNQSKNAYQAEIDSTCEICDFLRYNVKFMEEIYSMQPENSPGVWNRLEYRPLEGFVFAVTPFNFTSIAANLPTAPAMMGNTTIWKPGSTAVLSGYYLMQLFKEAGLPDGVINFVPGRGSQMGALVLPDPNLGGIHFTGSTPVFQRMWKTVGDNISKYTSYPRIVGETGGKDFIFVHESAEVQEVVIAAVRGAFEYQGQKCSAASRMYVPQSLWPEIRKGMEETIATIKMGDVCDFSNFFNAVIDEAAFDQTMDYISQAEESPDAEVIIGGTGDKTVGYFIEPTVVLARDPRFVTMREEIFAPVLTVYVYDDAKLDEALELCDTTSAYALTGAVFAKERSVIRMIDQRLRNAAGNFYINDKPTGAVVGQQPFGGARASGTNDKAGSLLNLIRWVSTRTIKETFVPARDYRYPFMG